jgi:hypothetical protein
MRRRRILLSALATTALAAAAIGTSPLTAKAADDESYPRSCGNNVRICAEVDDALDAFGHYVGHDEPSVLFDSNVPGSGNHMQYKLTLPKEPAGAYSNAKSYSRELVPTYWFGMTMCDTESFPEQTHTCTPDSDSNIVDPAVKGSYRHAPGAAYLELQFYPPGFAPQFADISCDAHKWCAALTIDSLSEDPIKGTQLNDTCIDKIGGSIEYVNFAYITLSGQPLGPPNPLDFDFTNSGDPRTVPGRARNDTLFMNQGDKLTLTLTDTAHGVQSIIDDATTGQSGSMTASAANGFGQIVYAPHGHKCEMRNYDFHPMFSTSSPKTRPLWTAHTYNVAMDAEIGHFDFCTHIDADSGTCDGLEGVSGRVPGTVRDQEPADEDDYGCFSAAEALDRTVTANYCAGSNVPGFDGTSYQRYWPDGSRAKPTSILFSSPLTGNSFNTKYSQFAFEADLPRIEAPDSGGSCDRDTGANCVNPPVTDDGAQAKFYPYFSTVSTVSGCRWGVGDTLPNTVNNYGGSSAQYGPLLQTTYWAFGGKGAPVQRYNNFNSGQMTNHC